MNKKLLIKSIFAFAMVMLVGMVGWWWWYLKMQTYQFPQDKTLAAWMWELPTEDATILHDLEREGFDTIYLSVSSYIGIYEMPKGKAQLAALAKYEQRLGKVLRQANALGIKVEALTGKSTWSNSSHRYLLVELYKFIQRFNEKSSVKFTGIQYDLEPYLQTNYTDNKNEILQEYLDTIEVLVELHQEATWQSDFRLGIAMPFWFDNNPIEWSNVTQGVGSHAITTLSRTPNSYVVLMSYRGTAVGPDGSAALSATLLNQANTRFVEVLIGQETKQIEPEKISFFGTSKQTVKRASQQLDLSLRHTPSYSGLVMHDAKGYLALPE